MEIDGNIFWVGHACFYIKADGATIFIDPFKISDNVEEKADLILVTHAHFDHFNKQDMEKVMKDDTKFILAKECAMPHTIANPDILAVAEPGFRSKFEGIKIEAVPAYNINPERLQNHPRSKDWIGYIIEANGKRVYHAGDTDNIPEMKNLKNIDVALLPMGGTYTMTVDEGIAAAKVINAKTVVPMHYKMLLGKEGSSKLEKRIGSELENSHIMKEVQDPIYSF